MESIDLQGVQNRVKSIQNTIFPRQQDQFANKQSSSIIGDLDKLAERINKLRDNHTLKQSEKAKQEKDLLLEAARTMQAHNKRLQEVSEYLHEIGGWNPDPAPIVLVPDLKRMQAAHTVPHQPEISAQRALEQFSQAIVMLQTDQNEDTLDHNTQIEHQIRNFLRTHQTAAQTGGEDNDAKCVKSLYKYKLQVNSQIGDVLRENDERILLDAFKSRGKECTRKEVEKVINNPNNSLRSQFSQKFTVDWLKRTLERLVQDGLLRVKDDPAQREKREEKYVVTEEYLRKYPDSNEN